MDISSKFNTKTTTTSANYSEIYGYLNFCYNASKTTTQRFCTIKSFTKVKSIPKQDAFLMTLLYVINPISYQSALKW